MQQEFSSEDEDEEYVYDEELNKTFNRTVEDITIDDISRHLETLEIEKKGDEDSDHELKEKNWKNSHQRRLQGNGMYKIPSNTKPHRIRQPQNANTPTYDDSDISMISHVSRKHTTRSGGRW